MGSQAGPVGQGAGLVDGGIVSSHTWELSVSVGVWWTERFTDWGELMGRVSALFPELDAADMDELEQSGELVMGDGIRVWIEEV